MAKKKLAIWHDTSDWRLSPVEMSTAAGRRARRSSPDLDTSFPEAFLAPNVRIAEIHEAEPKPERRATELPFLDFSVPVKDDESYVVAIRHPSGALTFHTGEFDIQRRRGPRGRPNTVRFRLQLRVAPDVSRRRGIISKTAKVIILRVGGAIADAVLPKLVAIWEARSWKARGLAEGWIKLDASSLKSGNLVPAVPTGSPTPSGRSLVLLHGTFSHAASAFKGLAATDFFARVEPLYGDQIFAVNHFTLSKTPDENARDLVERLPAHPITFDVITHSRGGLVLRNLVERANAIGPAAKRFDLQHAILVASPNEGTPLATPGRWKETVGWVATLVDHFPDTPLTFAASWVAESIVWLAQRAANGIPGLASMDSGGVMIHELQGPPGPGTKKYSALVANFSPDDQLLLKVLDVGIDAFFASANDLVVPTEGGWRVDWGTTGVPFIPSERIGCYGPGGNLEHAGGPVHHLNFFDRPETAEFLVRAVKGDALGLPPVDPTKPLPDSRFRRGAIPPAPTTRAAPAPAAPADTSRSSPISVNAPTEIPAPALAPVFSDAFQLSILQPQPANPDETLQLFASYGGARVIEPFVTKGGDAGQNFYKIIQMHERLCDYVDGKSGSRGPTDRELIKHGELLFQVLFPPEVRRLYDVARSRERAGHLNVIFTSMIPWIADKPWEFAFDPNRKTFLATEELHLVRNAITSIPAESISPQAGALRILVAVAQPVGSGKLSSQEEEAVIRRGFEPLVEAQLIEIEVLRSATPASLHRRISTGNFDVVHFIGHGEFDEMEQKGYLIFEDGRGSGQRVEARTAREILCQRGVRLVFLNACDTGRGGRADFNRGIAPALVAGGLPSVVANQFKVLDQSATEFAQHFYWALAQGMTLGAAAREARIAVNYSINGENIDWAVPVVYARDPESRLCARRTPGPEAISTPLISSSMRRATAAHTRRVAVWDINHIFPNLESTIHALNAAQTYFGFEVVDISTPIGTWQRYKGSSIQLHANIAAKRLRYKPQELGVDFLFCITDHPIMYETDGAVYWNYYNWWEPGEGNIIIFSVAFPDMPTSGRDADRAIANAIVTGLTGILADVGTHARRPDTCPLFHNPNRSLALVVDKQRFDDTCRRRLKRAIPNELSALENILKTFD